jgi:Zn-dependent protease with chaperone function
LVIGLPLLQVLTRAELRAVLTHEMAHLARGDATSAANSSRFVQGLGRAIDSAEAEALSPLWIWANLCRHVADRLHAPIAWGQEARADRAAASITGGDIAASALVKVAMVQPLFREVLGAFTPEPGEPNLYAFFRLFWSRLPESLYIAIRHKLLTDGEVSPDPAHPPLLDRIAAVQAYPSRPTGEFDNLPASSMLGDPEGFEAMLHNRLFSVGRVEPSVFHRRGR